MQQDRAIFVMNAANEFHVGGGRFERFSNRVLKYTSVHTALSDSRPCACWVRLIEFNDNGAVVPVAAHELVDGWINLSPKSPPAL